MILTKIFQNRKIVYCLLLLGFVNAILIGFCYNDHFYRGDTPSYVETARWLGGDKTADLKPWRLLKPLGLLVPMAFERVGLTGEHGLQFQNIIFYFLSIILLFDLVLTLTNNKKQGLFAAVLFIAAWPFLTNALAYLTDMAGWFFYLLCAWLIVKLHQANKVHLVNYALLLGLITGLGFLFKENAVAALFFYFGYLVFVNKQAIKKRLKSFIVFSIGFGLPVLICSAIVFWAFSYTFLDWYQWAWQDPDYYTFLNIFLNVGITFFLGWVFFFFGIFAAWKEKNREHLPWLLALLLPSLCSFIWPFPGARILYIAFPLLTLLGSKGLVFIAQKKGNILAIALLALYAFLNFFAPKVATYSQIRGLFSG